MKAVILIGLTITISLAEAGGYGNGNIATGGYGTNVGASVGSEAGKDFEAQHGASISVNTGIDTEAHLNAAGAAAANIKNDIKAAAINAAHEVEGYIEKGAEIASDVKGNIKENIDQISTAIHDAATQAVHNAKGSYDAHLGVESQGLHDKKNTEGSLGLGGSINSGIDGNANYELSSNKHAEHETSGSGHAESGVLVGVEGGGNGAFQGNDHNQHGAGSSAHVGSSASVGFGDNYEKKAHGTADLVTNIGKSIIEANPNPLGTGTLGIHHNENGLKNENGEYQGNTHIDHGVGSSGHVGSSASVGVGGNFENTPINSDSNLNHGKAHQGKSLNHVSSSNVHVDSNSEHSGHINEGTTTGGFGLGGSGNNGIYSEKGVEGSLTAGPAHSQPNLPNGVGHQTGGSAHGGSGVAVSTSVDANGYVEKKAQTVGAFITDLTKSITDQKKYELDLISSVLSSGNSNVNLEGSVHGKEPSGKPSSNVGLNGATNGVGGINQGGREHLSDGYGSSYSSSAAGPYGGGVSNAGGYNSIKPVGTVPESSGPLRPQHGPEHSSGSSGLHNGGVLGNSMGGHKSFGIGFGASVGNAGFEGSSRGPYGGGGFNSPGRGSYPGGFQGHGNYGGYGPHGSYGNYHGGFGSPRGYGGYVPGPDDCNGPDGCGRPTGYNAPGGYPANGGYGIYEGYSGGNPYGGGLSFGAGAGAGAGGYGY